MNVTSTRRAFTLSAAALAVGLGLSALAPLAHAQSVDDIKKKGEITIGMLVDFPPYGTMNSSNQPDGYDADVAKLLAKDWGVKLNLVPVTGPNRIPFLLTNTVDLLVASLAVTPERAKQVQFSTPYAAASIVLYGAKKANLKTPEDLKGACRTITPEIEANRGWHIPSSASRHAEARRGGLSESPPRAAPREPPCAASCARWP